MKLRRVFIIWFTYFICISNLITGCKNNSTEKRIILEQTIRIRNMAIQRGAFSEESYENLCALGFLYLAEAIARKDLGDLEYRENIKKSIEYYNNAIIKNNELAGAYKGLFNVYSFLEDDINALDNIKHAIELNQNDFDALFMFGNFYFEKEDYKNAIVWLEKAEKLAEAHPHLYGKAGRKGFKKMIEKAKSRLR